MKARDLMALLAKAPTNYWIDRQAGSHKQLRSHTHPPLTFAFHDNQTIPPGLVKKILVKDIGLTVDEISDILR